jgi:tetratricopeptide (TPR) repeat protein
LGQPEKAGGAAEAMLVALPDRPEAYQEAARIYGRLHMEPQAWAVFDRGIAAMPKSGTLYSLRAQFRPKSDIEGRRKDLEQAALLEPHNYSILAQRADVEAAARNYVAAISGYTAALEQGNPKGLQLVAVLTGRGLAETMAGKQAAAAGDFKLAQENAKTPSGLNFICWNLATNNIALPTALASCDAALAKSPRIAAILDSKGFTLLRMGRYQDAITAYDAAIDIRPGLAGSLLGRGVAKRQSGDAQGGAAAISAAQKLDPEVVGEFGSYGVRI